MDIFKKEIKNILLACCLYLEVQGCFFDANLLLQNDPPSCINLNEIRTTIIYPKNSVCTLSITDRNDAVLSIYYNTMFFDNGGLLSG